MIATCLLSNGATGKSPKTVLCIFLKKTLTSNLASLRDLPYVGRDYV